MKRFNQYVKALRWALAIVMCVVCSLPSFGSKTTYYYNMTVNAEPTGGGKVYVSTNPYETPDYKDKSMSLPGSGQSYGSSASSTFYFKALPNDGYLFDHWAKTKTGPSLSTSQDYYATESYNGTEDWWGNISRTPITYYAVFTQQTGLVQVQVAEVGRGTVSINNPNNTLNSTVTLTANPDASNGVVFLGWNKDRNDTENFISTSNPYTLTVTNETAGTYYAHFSEAAEHVYCRIKNNQTGRFLSLCGSQVAGNHTRDITVNNKTYKNVNDGLVFINSLKMISAEEAQGNPMTVFVRNGNPVSAGITVNGDLVANHVQYQDLCDHNDNTNQYPLTMELTSTGSIRIYTEFTTTVNNKTVSFRSYLCDEGGTDGWLVMKSTEGLTNVTGLDWTIYILDENTTDGALGANTKSKYTKDGKYYTTMYTYFPYKLLDGVKAYYLPVSEESYNEENNTVVFTEIASGIVPADAAVILECNDVQNGNGDVTDVKNRILPLPESAVGESDHINPDYNYLKGYISMYGKENPKNDHNLMYILSYGNGKLGFFHYSQDEMPANKAYLVVPEVVVDAPQAKTATFSFGDIDEEEGTVTKIEMSEEVVNEADGDIYDLSGRKVENPGRGIYIRNNKKFVVK